MKFDRWNFARRRNDVTLDVVVDFTFFSRRHPGAEIQQEEAMEMEGKDVCTGQRRRQKRKKKGGGSDGNCSARILFLLLFFLLTFF